MTGAELTRPLSPSPLYPGGGGGGGGDKETLVLEHPNPTRADTCQVSNLIYYAQNRTQNYSERNDVYVRM